MKGLALTFRTYKKKFTYDVLSGIATCLIDGTVFEIVKGLEDIQQLSERNLLNKRMKIVNSQKGKICLNLSSNFFNESNKWRVECILDIFAHSDPWKTKMVYLKKTPFFIMHQKRQNYLIKIALGKSKNLRKQIWSSKGQFIKSNYPNLLHNHFPFSSATRYQKYFKRCHFPFTSLLFSGKV